MLKYSNNKITIIIGVTISFIIFLTTLKLEMEKDKILIISSTNNITNKIESTLSNLKRVNDELISRFYLLDEISASEFNFYTKAIIKQYDFIEEIIFAENIPLRNKRSYEQAFVEKGYSGFKISPFSNNTPKKSPSRNHLIPVKFIEPFTVKNSQWFGRDLLTYSLTEDLVNLKEYANAIRYTTNKKGIKKLYAIQTLYSDHNNKKHDATLKNTYGILMYKIALGKLITTKAYKSTIISLGDIKIFEKNTGKNNTIFDTTTTIEQSIQLSNHLLNFKFTHRKNIFSTNLILPVFLFVLSLIITWFIWYVIRTHIQINIILSKQNKIIEKKVHIKTEELKARADEMEAFSYSVSHDLRTPLNAIDGFSQLLLENHHVNKDSDATDNIKHICDASVKMGHIIDDLLKLAHVSRANFKKKHTNISKLIEKSIHIMREYEPERNIDIIIQNDIYADVDADFIQISFDNLIGNAWKYTKYTVNPRIEFGTTKKDGELAYYVKDNGAGFNMHDANKLFIPFQRLHQNNQFSGVGVGLSIVQRIIQKHIGEIWASSEVGKGATFYFTLGSH